MFGRMKCRSNGGKILLKSEHAEESFLILIPFKVWALKNTRLIACAYERSVLIVSRRGAG